MAAARRSVCRAPGELAENRVAATKAAETRLDSGLLRIAVAFAISRLRACALPYSLD
jgi:hypothetical protein